MANDVNESVETQIVVDDDIVLDVVYRTTDFEFTAVALALQTPKVKVAALIPYDSATQKDKDRIKYLFCLLGTDAGEPDWHQQLKQLALKYTNGQLRVEPTALAGKRKFLRGLLLDHRAIKDGGIKMDPIINPQPSITPPTFEEKARKAATHA